MSMCGATNKPIKWIFLVHVLYIINRSQQQNKKMSLSYM